MGFEHPFFAEVSKQLSSRNIFHEHVDVFGGLGKSREVDLSWLRLTMKGWEMELRILYSLLMWSTCWALMSSAFFMIFTHEYLCVLFFLARRTVPKEPRWEGEYLLQEWWSFQSLSDWCPCCLVFRLSSTCYLIILFLSYMEKPSIQDLSTLSPRHPLFVHNNIPSYTQLRSTLILNRQQILLSSKLLFFVN